MSVYLYLFITRLSFNPNLPPQPPTRFPQSRNKKRHVSEQGTHTLELHQHPKATIKQDMYQSRATRTLEVHQHPKATIKQDMNQSRATHTLEVHQRPGSL